MAPERDTMKKIALIAVLAAPVAMTGTAGLADGLYAAIAFSPSTGLSGSAWNFDSDGDAQAEAATQCGVDDCYTAVVFQQCGAIAVGDGYGMGFAEGGAVSTAETTALASCDQYTTNCQITASFCNEGF
jgi:hypothetical protein